MDNQTRYGSNNSEVPENALKFIARLEHYLEEAKAYNPDFVVDPEDVRMLTMDELDNLTRNECFDRAYVLYGYAEHLNAEMSAQKALLNWASMSIRWLIQGMTFPDWTKHEMKEVIAARENPLAKAAVDLKLHAESKIEHLRNKVEFVKRRAETLSDKGKRL